MLLATRNLRQDETESSIAYRAKSKTYDRRGRIQVPDRTCPASAYDRACSFGVADRDAVRGVGIIILVERLALTIVVKWGSNRIR